MGMNGARNNNYLLVPILLLILCQKSVATSLKSKQISSLRLARIQRHLDKINKPPLLTIESPDGDIIDCVQKTKQAALDHPLLKNHKIQMVPSKIPKGDVKMEKRNNTSSAILMWQTWHEKGQMCPNGTVPVRRSTVEDVLRAKSLYHFAKKSTTPPPPNAPTLEHEHAVAFTPLSLSEIYGAKASINVWDPTVEGVSNEFSLSQIWVMSGSFGASDLNTIEAGWQVSPQLYGDTRPRLFTYWTRDAYQATGCYNLLCSGFVQTNTQITVGAAISSVSSLAGNQYDVTILIWKDPKFGNWWLGIGNQTLGYWPKELFTHLADRATMVEWGGEIINSQPNNQHTSTQMGSGRFAEEGFGKASYFRNLEIVDSDNSLISARDIAITAEKSNCYNIRNFYNDEWGTHFYYGGPGKNPLCP